MADIGEPTGADQTRDRYLITPDPGANIKISQGELQVKRLLTIDRGFQRWAPVWKTLVPLWPQDLRRLFREGGIEIQFEHLPGCWWVSVSKVRQRFEIDGSPAEATEVTAVYEEA